MPHITPYIARLLLTLFLTLPSCKQESPNTPITYRLSGKTMGTTWSFSAIANTPQQPSKEELSQTIQCPQGVYRSQSAIWATG